MLESLRSFVSGWVAKVLLVLLVGSFALWGVTGSILGGAYSNTVAEVGETSVSIRDFVSVYNRNMNEMQQQIGRRLTREEGRLFGVETRTLSNVVSFAALDEYARINNLSLSEDMMARLLGENPQFQDSTGKFNRDTFRRAVYTAQMREGDYIALQNASAVRAQVTEAFATGDILPAAFKTALGQYANEERKFSHITVTAEHAGTPSAPTDEDLKSYFDANIKTYAAPEFRKLEILRIEPKDIADEKSISSEDIAADYEERKSTYETPEKRRVQQIVFKSQDNADAAVKALAEGAVFETILSDNNVTLSDADLGMLSKAQLPKAVQDTAFSLEINTPSATLKGPFGPTMIRVSEITDASTTPLETVKDDIRKALALARAVDSITDMQETVEDARAGGGSLVDIGKKLGLETRTVEAIDRSARTPDLTVISDLPSSRDLLAQAFQTEVGAQASPLDVNSTGYVWYDVVAITPARDRKQDEVSERLKMDWTAAEQAKLIAKKADTLKDRLTKGAQLAEVALDLGVLPETTGFLKRNGNAPGFSAAATKAGYTGDAKNIAVVDGEKPGEKMLIVVAERKGSDAQAINVPDDQVTLANQGAADDLLTQMITNLQSQYAVTSNPTAINLALSPQGGN